MYRHSTPSVLPYLIEVHFTSTSPPRVHAYCPAPAGFAASAMPSRDADITESNNVRNQHGLSGRILLQNTDLHIPVLHLQRASPEISNSAMPCSGLHTHLSAELRKKSSPTQPTPVADRSAEGSRAPL
jgi:hypothetical protein